MMKYPAMNLMMQPALHLSVGRYMFATRFISLKRVETTIFTFNFSNAQDRILFEYSSGGGRCVDATELLEIESLIAALTLSLFLTSNYYNYRFTIVDNVSVLIVSFNDCLLLGRSVKWFHWYVSQKGATFNSPLYHIITQSRGGPYQCIVR